MSTALDMDWRWKRPSCSNECAPRWHDLDAHEEYGYQRAVNDLTPRVVTIGPLVIDLAAERVTVNDRPIRLTPNEWKILAYLARHLGVAVSRDEAICAVWGREFLNPFSRGYKGRRSDYQTLRTNVSRLRMKLGAARHLLVTGGAAAGTYRLEVEP